jgi:hypothetical protein
MNLKERLDTQLRIPPWPVPSNYVLPNVDKTSATNASYALEYT